MAMRRSRSPQRWKRVLVSCSYWADKECTPGHMCRAQSHRHLATPNMFCHLHPQSKHPISLVATNLPTTDGWKAEFPSWLTGRGCFTHSMVAQPTASLTQDRESSLCWDQQSNLCSMPPTSIDADCNYPDIFFIFRVRYLFPIECCAGDKNCWVYYFVVCHVHLQWLRSLKLFCRVMLEMNCI